MFTTNTVLFFLSFFLSLSLSFFFSQRTKLLVQFSISFSLVVVVFTFSTVSLCPLTHADVSHLKQEIGALDELSRQLFLETVDLQEAMVCLVLSKARHRKLYMFLQYIVCVSVCMCVLTLSTSI